MKILSIDTSNNICSIAVLEDTTVIYEKSMDSSLTHSKTLMPMIKEAFDLVHLTLQDIDLFACCKGPGSFTGIRIGIATIKAFVDVYHKPCLGISSLEALAYRSMEDSHMVCPLIDAKHSNVYLGLFANENGISLPQEDEKAFSLEECIIHLKEKKLSSLSFVGDGTFSYQEMLKENFPDSTFHQDIMQSDAISVGKAAYFRYLSHRFSDSDRLLHPLYLKKAQAERMLMEKKKEEN